MKKLKIGLIFFFLISIFISSMLPAFGKEGTFLCEQDIYAEAVIESDNRLQPDYHYKKPLLNPFNHENKNKIKAFEAFYLQIDPEERERIFSYWVPQVPVTIVIAIDRNLTEEKIKGWKDLLKTNEPIFISDKPLILRLIAPAIAYGLEGKTFSKKAAIDYMENLKNINRDSGSSAIFICSDMEAAKLKKDGRNIEIIVPDEGTFYYTLGIMSTEPVNYPSEELLLKKGLRLIDGRTTNPIYPTKKEYMKAIKASNNPEHFYKVSDGVPAAVKRKVFKEKLISSSNSFEHVVFPVILIILTTIWIGTAINRSVHPGMKRSFIHVGTMINLWLGIRLFKYQLNGTFLSRMCWYSFYIFIMGIPIIMLHISLITDKPFNKKKIPKPTMALSIIYFILLIAVFTNDYHRKVFSFNINGNWSDKYNYEFIYYIIAVFCALTVFTSFCILIKKAKDSPKKYAVLLPVILLLTISVYAYGYIKNVKIIRNGDLTTVSCFLCLLYFETIIRIGLLPSNKGYMELFSLSPLNIKLLDKEGQTVLSSENSFVNSNYKPNDIIIHKSPISGGTVVWEENIKELNLLQNKYKESMEQIRHANELLGRETEINREKTTGKIRLELYMNLKKIIENEIMEIEDVISTYENSENKQKEVAYIALLLCHLKKHCNLFFLIQESKLFSASEFIVYLDELSAFASYTGVNTLVRSNLTGTIPIKIAAIIYDFYFNIILWSLKESNSSIIGKLEIKEDFIVFLILSSKPVNINIIPLPFREHILKIKGEIEEDNSNNDISFITLKLPLEGVD